MLTTAITKAPISVAIIATLKVFFFLYIRPAVNTKNETSSNTSDTDSGTMKNDSNSNIEQSNEKEQTESYIKTTKGSSAGLPFSKAMLQFKEYVDKFNLDLQVCKELSDLFMNIY